MARRLKKLASGAEDEGAEGKEQYNPGNGDKEALVAAPTPIPTNRTARRLKKLASGAEAERASAWRGG
jgi:hypothetical protein